LRAYVFRFGLEIGHCSMQPACLKRAKTGLAQPTQFVSLWRGSNDKLRASETFDFMEFEMKHCASTPSMIARARSSSALSLRATRGRTITSVMRYLPSSRPSASLSYRTGVRPFAWASLAFGGSIGPYSEDGFSLKRVIFARLSRPFRPVHVGVAPKATPATAHQHRRHPAPIRPVWRVFSSRLPT
jgi:hypothetical protein